MVGVALVEVGSQDHGLEWVSSLKVAEEHSQIQKACMNIITHVKLPRQPYHTMRVYLFRRTVISLLACLNSCSVLLSDAYVHSECTCTHM